LLVICRSTERRTIVIQGCAGAALLFAGIEKMDVHSLTVNHNPTYFYHSTMSLEVP
jgi:hypothetical protein